MYRVFGNNVPYLGRTFLGLIDTDVTGSACIRIWRVTDWMSRQEYSLFVVLHTVSAWRGVVSVHFGGSFLSL